MSEWISQEELCNWLKVSTVTAWKWRKEGMPHIGSRQGVRYNKKEVEQWLREKGKK